MLQMIVTDLLDILEWEINLHFFQALNMKWNIYSEQESSVITFW